MESSWSFALLLEGFITDQSFKAKKYYVPAALKAPCLLCVSLALTLQILSSIPACVLCFVWELQKKKRSLFPCTILNVSVTCKELVCSGIKLHGRDIAHQSGRSSCRNRTCFCLPTTRVVAVFKLLSSNDNESMVCIVRSDTSLTGRCARGKNIRL